MTADKNRRPLVLITNDDGIKAGGLRALVEMAEKYADVVVVAPNQSYSGMSHSITIKIPLYAKLIREKPGFKLYKINGTPVDCIKLGVNTLLECRPDFVLSGINHGSNASVSIHYSGTMGCCTRGGLAGDPGHRFLIARPQLRGRFFNGCWLCRNHIQTCHQKWDAQRELLEREHPHR
jgi:5''/3''-nucleotidase SurE